MNELTQAGAWIKTCHLIQEKYGKKLEFRSLNLADGTDHFYSKGDDLIIPLKAHQHYLGDVIINRGSTLSNTEKEEVVDLVKFLIEPQAYNLHLQRIENGQADNEQTVLKNNIISLFGNASRPEFKKKILSNMIHLTAASPMLRHKVALKIHEMTGGQFMTRFQDISGTLHSIEDLMSLGEISIYIEDVCELSPNEVQLLEDFSKLTKSSDVVFLIGSNMSDEQINNSNFNTNLKNDLLGFLFNIDRVPVDQQMNEDILDLLFFSYDQQLS